MIDYALFFVAGAIVIVVLLTVIVFRMSLLIA